VHRGLKSTLLFVAVLAFIVVLAWAILSGVVVRAYTQLVFEPWTAFTAIGTLSLALATVITLRRDRDLRKIERTPNIVLQHGEIDFANRTPQAHDAPDSSQFVVRLHMYNLGKYPVYITRLRFVYFWADVTEKQLFSCVAREHVGANEKKLVEVPLHANQFDGQLPKNSAMYLEFLHGASGPQQWKVMIPVASAQAFPMELGPEQTHPKEIPHGFYGDEYLLG
jgi:hypothetical protein